DLHGASLCRALRGLEPSCRLFGMGGARMAAAGMDLMEDVTATAVVGHSEAVGQVPRLYRAYRKLRAALSGPERPGVLVLIDFPEFNLRLARAARRAGVPVVYFIPPQIWAWRGHRVRAIWRFVSLVLAVFPFELPLYRQAGVRVEVVAGQTYAVVRAADLLLVTSGTVTLEAALLGTPMVVCYRLSRVSEILVRLLIRVPWVSLANLTLGRAVVPELYQRAMTGDRLA